MKKIFFLFLALSYLSLSAHVRFTGRTHQFLFERGLVLLAQDNQRLGLDLLSQFSEDLLTYVTEPDQTETSFFTFKGHFYDPITETNWQGESGNTALTNFLFYAKQGVLPQNGDWIHDLGYALHYLEDACQPHHATNLIAYFSKHREYEQFVETIHDKILLEHNLYSYKSLTTSNFEADLTSILRNCGLKNRTVIDKIEYTDNEEIWFQASTDVLKESQSAVALFLYRFMLEKSKR